MYDTVRIFQINAMLSRHGLRIVPEETLQGVQYSIRKEGHRHSENKYSDTPFFNLTARTLKESLDLAAKELAEMGASLSNEELKAIGVTAPPPGLVDVHCPSCRGTGLGQGEPIYESEFDPIATGALGQFASPQYSKVLKGYKPISCPTCSGRGHLKCRPF
jgi:hypothetical protein